MSQYKVYPEYKDSGVEWIGQIPKEWKIVKLKHIASILSGYSFKSDNFVENGIPIIRIGDIRKNINWENTKKVLLDNEKEYERFIVKHGDVLIAMTGATIGKTAVYKSLTKAVLNQRVGIFRNKSNYNGNLLGYIVDSYIFKEPVRVLSYGGAQENIGINDLGNISLPLLDLTSQDKLVFFLNKKTSEIDNLISDKERLIELLEEKRQAVITETVTKGLDPNVEMKDSGIEWIGEIPKHWTVNKLKHHSDIIMGQSIDNSDISFNMSEIPFLQGNADFSTLNPIPRNYCLKGKKHSENGDILLSVRAPVGAMNISDRNYAIGRGLSAIRVHSNYISYYWFALKVFKEELESKMTGSTFEAVTIEDVKNLTFIIPPKKEMILIGEELEAFDKVINKTIKSMKNQISKLKEYRESLIYEAVTGKIDVRDYAVKQEEVY